MRHLVLVGLCLVVVGCGETTASGPDVGPSSSLDAAGSAQDAAGSARDAAGLAPDAGQGPVDAASPHDASSAPDGSAGDPCDDDNGGCDPLTTCTSSGGVPTCGPCPAGYTGTGATGCVAPASLKVVGAKSKSATSVEVEFDAEVDQASVKADGSQFTFTEGLTASAAAPAVSAKKVLVTTSAQALGKDYTVTVASSVTAVGGAAVGSTNNTAQFKGPLGQARLRLNEINPNIPNSRDLLEFLVVEGGTTRQLSVMEEGKKDDPLTFSTLPDVAVEAGDIIVLHLNPVGTGDPKSSERTSKSESTAAGAYPNAWDFVGGSASVTWSHRVIKVVASDGTVQDAVAFAKVGLPEPLPGGFVTAVQAAQAEGQWLPVDCGGAPCTYTSTPSAIDISVDWSGVGNTSGSSVSRPAGLDTGTKADWVLKATGASFGSPNP